jgi:hypothetical protein
VRITPTVEFFRLCLVSGSGNNAQSFIITDLSSPLSSLYSWNVHKDSGVCSLFPDILAILIYVCYWTFIILVCASYAECRDRMGHTEMRPEICWETSWTSVAWMTEKETEG